MRPDSPIEALSWVAQAPPSPTATAPSYAALHRGMEPTPRTSDQPDNLTRKGWMKLHALLSKCGKSERARVHRRVVRDMRAAGQHLSDNRTVVPVRLALRDKFALSALAHSRGWTRSDVLRAAVRDYLDGHRDEVQHAFDADIEADAIYPRASHVKRHEVDSARSAVET